MFVASYEQNKYLFHLILHLTDFMDEEHVIFFFFCSTTNGVIFIFSYLQKNYTEKTKQKLYPRYRSSISLKK